MGRYGRGWITAALIVILAISLIRLISIVPQRINKDDFSHYYIATKIFLSGHTPYGKNLVPLYPAYGFVSKGKQLLTTDYPPVFFDIFAPFAALNPRQGFIFWFAFEVACLFYILLLCRSLLKTDFTVNTWLIFSILIVLSNWVYYQFYFSQVGLFLAALVLTAFALNQREKHDAACILVSLAGMIKFFPFIILPWFMWRKKKFRAFPLRQIVVVFLAIATIILLSGLHHWINYYTLAPKTGMVANSYLRLLNYSLSSFIVNIGYALHHFQLDSLSWQFFMWIATFCGLLVIGWGYLFCWKTPADRALEFCILTVVMLLGFPRSFEYLLIFLIFPMAVMFIRTLQSGSRHSLLAFVAVYLLLDLHHMEFVLLFLHFRPSLLVLLLVTYIPFYGLLGLLWFYYKSIKSEHQCSNLSAQCAIKLV